MVRAFRYVMQHARWVILLGATSLTAVWMAGCSGHATSAASAGAAFGGEGGAARDAPHIGGAGGTHADGCNLRAVCDYDPLGAFLECPTTLQDYVPDCSIYGGIQIERYDSQCGGTVIQATDGIQTERWTFAASGELVGTNWNGDVGDYGCWGDPCAMVGSPEVLCDQNFGPGGGGASGAGGASEQGGSAG